MGDQQRHYVQTALIGHKLLECSASILANVAPKSGGLVKFMFHVNTPDTPDILHINDEFSIAVGVEIEGTSHSTNEITFKAFCKMEGNYKLLDCNDCGTATKDNISLWKMASSQLCPVLSQFSSELIERMGFANIKVPSYLPDFKEFPTPSSKNTKKARKK